MEYCNIYGDYDDMELYLYKEPAIDVRYCPKCNMVTNREEAILAAAKVFRWRKKKFFFSTYDGVYIATKRFYAIYHQYNMQGIEFIPFEKSAGYYICEFINIMHYDVEHARQMSYNYMGKTTYGIIDNGICPVCKRSKGHHQPYPYRMIKSDEQQLQRNTFYRSDIEFAENNFQQPLIWATDGIVQAFTHEVCRIFYHNVEGDFGEGDCGKPRK